MPKLDLILLVVFGTFTVLGLLSCVLCFRAAIRVAGKKESELKMFFWAVGGMVGLIIAGVSFAYILLPLLMNL